MSKSEIKTNEKKDDDNKNKACPPIEKPECDQELLEKEFLKLISIIKSLIPEEILFRIQPELKDSYISKKNGNLEINSLIKIPYEKMNEEESF